ncbi:MAG: HEAT repeat domain-containing protein [Chitinophagaceae bacterium]
MQILGIFNVFYTYYAKITSFPFIIQLCIIFILGCFIAFSIFLAALSYIRYLFNKKVRKENKLSPVIDELLVKFLFDEESKYSEFEIYNEFTSKIGKLSKSNLNLITDRFIKCKNSFNFKSDQRFLTIINAIGLEKHIDNKLDFSSAFNKMKGIQELSNLSISTSESKIIPYTYSGNNQLKKEARNSYVRLSKNDPFKYFEDSNEQLNEWDQINLLKNLMNIENTIVPNFSKWIAYSKNDSIISFSLKMCAFFKQQESIPTIIEFLKTENHNLRAEAFKTLGELGAGEYENMMKEMYPNQPENCQKEIIRSIGKFNSGLSLDFLSAQYSLSNETDTKKVIAESILNYENKGNETFSILMNSEKDFSRLILQHIANPLIKFK